MNNSIQQVVDYLKQHPFTCENDINIQVFGYERKTSSCSNKKYAEMIRNGLRNGIIKRIEKRGVFGHKARFWYYI